MFNTTPTLLITLGNGSAIAHTPGSTFEWLGEDPVKTVRRVQTALTAVTPLADNLGVVGVANGHIYVGLRYTPSESYEFVMPTSAGVRGVMTALAATFQKAGRILPKPGALTVAVDQALNA